MQYAWLEHHRSARRAFALIASLVLVLTAGAVAGITGSIHPGAIEIDNSANLYPGDGSAGIKNAGATLDWVKDSLANTDTPSLVDSVATGIKTSAPSQTGAAGGTGHWNGVRIVDGVAGGDQDIFLTGGKENDTTTWNVGPGTVGSAKYDATQAYLANNQTTLFFGMERRGNNGTTAFDFEFNQLAPQSGYLPTRSVGDILFTFEMQGAGNSGSAVPFAFRWDGDSYEPVTPFPAGLVASINNAAATAAPWGRVDSKGNWVLTDFERFELAEAAAPLSLLPGVNACGGSAYVQVRTRSAATATSDLKDTTRIFQFLFGGPSAEAQLSTDCLQQFTYGSTGSSSSAGGTTGLTYEWDIDVTPATATLSQGGVTAVNAAAGQYTSASASGTVLVTLPAGVNSATITIQNTVTENGSCSDSSGTKQVTVYRQLGAVATLTPKCDNTFDFSSTVSGGLAPYTYSWTMQKNSLANGSGTWAATTGTFTAGSATSASGTFQASGPGHYRALLEVKDSAAAASSDPDVTTKPQCTVNVTSNAINVYSAVGGSISLTPDCDDTFTYSSLGTGGKAPYTYDVTIEKLVAGAWVTAHTFSASDTIASPGISGTLDVDSFATAANGDGRYRARVTITDSQSIVCTRNATSNEVDIRHALTASAGKTSADGSALSVLLTGTSAVGADLQWQRFNGATWVDIAGATSTTLTYSAFEADDTASIVTFQIATGDAAGSYAGKLWEVQLRLKATRTLNGQLCEATSDAVVVSKVEAVDP